MKYFLRVVKYIRRRPNATVMGIKLTMKRKVNFICLQDIKDSGAIVFDFGQIPPFKRFFIRYLIVKVHCTSEICMSTDEGFFE